MQTGICSFAGFCYEFFPGSDSQSWSPITGAQTERAPQSELPAAWNTELAPGTSRGGKTAASPLRGPGGSSWSGRGAGGSVPCAPPPCKMLQTAFGGSFLLKGRPRALAVRAAKLLEAAPSRFGFRLSHSGLCCCIWQNRGKFISTSSQARPSAQTQPGRTNCTEGERGSIQSPRKPVVKPEMISPPPTRFCSPSHLSRSRLQAESKQIPMPLQQQHLSHAGA